MQVADLEPRIYAILSAPGIDLSTISAKRVRRRLQADDDVSRDLIKDNKDAVNTLIQLVFSRVSQEKGFQQDQVAAVSDAGGDGAEYAEPVTAPKKRSRASQDDHVGGGSQYSSSAKVTKLSTAGDEALARQLSEQINGRGRSSRSSAASGASSSRGGRSRGRGRGRGRGAKSNGSRSADTIDDEGSDGDESKKKRGGGLSKEYNLSEPLAALVQEDSLSRPQVVKKLWAYIKSNNLQNPSNGREILCDGVLKAVFNTDKIDMFKMNKELGKHLSEPSETTA